MNLVHRQIVNVITSLPKCPDRDASLVSQYNQEANYKSISPACRQIHSDVILIHFIDFTFSHVEVLIRLIQVFDLILDDITSSSTIHIIGGDYLALGSRLNAVVKLCKALVRSPFALYIRPSIKYSLALSGEASLSLSNSRSAACSISQTSHCSVHIEVLQMNIHTCKLISCRDVRW